MSQAAHDGKILNIISLNNEHNVVLAYGFSALLFATANNLSTPVFEYKHAFSITSITFLPGKNLIIYTDIMKKMFIFDVASKELKSTRNIHKRASKLVANKDESQLLIADKTGDVYTLNMADFENNEFKLLMGHLSVVTDLKLTSDEKFVITSDRDEKIRISCCMNSYNIEAFLLAHKEFVTQIELIGDGKLISCSGDSRLILWDLEQALPRQIINTVELGKRQMEDGFVARGIDKMDFDAKSNRLVTHLYKSKSLLEFKYLPELGEFQFAFELVCEARVDFFMRIQDNLYLLISDNKFEVKSICDGQFQQVEDSPFKIYLNQNIDLQNIQPEIENEYENLFKNIIYQNVNLYYEKKQERIQATSAPKKAKPATATV